MLGRGHRQVPRRHGSCAGRVAPWRHDLAKRRSGGDCGHLWCRFAARRFWARFWRVAALRGLAKPRREPAGGLLCLVAAQCAAAAGAGSPRPLLPHTVCDILASGVHSCAPRQVQRALCTRTLREKLALRARYRPESRATRRRLPPDSLCHATSTVIFFFISCR